MIKFFANFICCFIIGHNNRQRVRERILAIYKTLGQYYLAIKIILRFLLKHSFHSRRKRVLIVEPNPYHGEIIPGFIKYFKDIEYEVFCLLRKELESENIFIKCPSEFTNFICYIDPSIMKILLNFSPFINREFDIIFISSSAFWDTTTYMGAFIDFFNKLQERENTIFVEHNPRTFLAKYKEINLLEKKRLFSIGGFLGIPMLNPHYFGNIAITSKNSDKTQFIVVGAINSDYKNHKLLINTVDSLVKKGITNFEVIIIGSGDLFIPHNLQHYITFYGRLNFEQMFYHMENADYYLPLLDIENRKHLKYLGSTCTGSRQLILGFLKPCIIDETFGETYGFNNENSIVYKNNDLLSAIEYAISLSKSDYDKKQSKLHDLQRKIYTESLSNLKQTVHMLKNREVGGGILLKKILFILGTRPEVIKLAPLILELKKHPKKWEVIVCNTGQQAELSSQALSYFGLIADFDLKVMKKDQSLSSLQSRLLTELQKVYDAVKTDITFVQGDTMTAFSGALVSFYNKVPVYHIEAGLRSYDLTEPFPEEALRQMISRISALHFSPTNRNKKNLLQEGIPEKQIYLVGNTVIDALQCISMDTLDEAKRFFETENITLNDKIVLVTAHRRENHGKRLDSIIAAIDQLADEYPEYNFIIPVHPNPNVKEKIYTRLNHKRNIYLLPPLDYPKIVCVMKKAKLILTDSGGIQEEAPSFGCPVLVMRYETERIEGIESGTSVLVGAEIDKILNESRKILSSNRKVYGSTKNPFGDGKSSERIEHILTAIYNGELF